MSATAETPKSPSSDFMAAEEIKGILKHLEKTEQQRVLRWVGESLGLAEMPPMSGVHMPEKATPQPRASLAQAGQNAPAVSAGGRVKDLKTFVQEKSPRSDVHFAAVIAYYYHFEAPESDRKENITAADCSTSATLAQG